MTTPAGFDEKSNPAKRAGTEPSVASKDDETLKAPSVSSFATALGAYDWPGVQALLDSTDFSSRTQATLAEALRRGKGLFFEYPAPAKEKKRDLLLKHLVEHLTAKYGAVPEEVAQVLDTLTVAEAGYRKILETLKGTDASKLEPALRVAAAMASTDRLVAAVLKEMEEQAGKRGAVGQHMRVELENGSSYDPSAALENLVRCASLTIGMEAVNGKWFDAADNVVIPAPPPIADDDAHKVEETLALAGGWRRWKLTEETARLVGGRLRFLAETERPPRAAVEWKRFILHDGAIHRDLVHRVATERLHGRFAQNSLEILANQQLASKFASQPSAQHVLPPRGYISHEEMAACWSLSEALAYDVREDQDKPGGLRLVEWVRGYCALLQLVERGKTSDFVRTKSGWLYFFADYALRSEVAEQLIDRLTFKRTSRDLFDQPFLKREDGKYQLFRASFASVNVASVVTSALSNLRESFEKKGKSFEAVVAKTLKAAGLETFSFEVSRDGEPYEYDVVLPWGDYLFVFECKNRALPNGNPVQMHDFDIETVENVAQLHRLMQALEDYPNILEEQLPPGAGELKRVPVLLNCLPFAAPGKVDGVYMYDYSALARFLASGQIQMKTAIKGQGTTAVKDGPRIWKGSVPTANDFLAQLESPVQFQAVLETLERNDKGYPMPPDWWVISPELRRLEHPIVRQAMSERAVGSSDGVAPKRGPQD